MKKNKCVTKESKSKSSKKKNCTSNVLSSPRPGPSHIYISDSSDFTDDEDDGTLCCVCNLWTPKEIRNSVSLLFTKWAECHGCGHWTHLIYCTEQRVVRMG